MNKIEVILEKFTRVRFAEWAGDFDYAQALLKDIAINSIGELGENLNLHPLGVLHNTIEILKARLDHAVVMRPEGSPHIFDTYNYFRGVVWRAGRNDFEMRAYLNDFNWEEEFYRRVAIRNEFLPESLAWPIKTGVITNGVNEIAKRAQIDRRRGGSWILDGRNFFREVVVSDIGLFRVKGLWSKRQLPRTRTPIIRGFQEVLRDLDANDITASR